MQSDVDKNKELSDKHEVLKGLCSHCHSIQVLYYDSKDHLKCKVCHSMYVEVMYKEIEG